MTIYRPAPLRGIAFVIVGLLFVSIGLVGIFDNGPESASLFGISVLLGMLLGVMGVKLLMARVVTADHGIVKLVMSHAVFELRWSDIESWSANSSRFSDRHDDSFTFRMLEFRPRKGGVLVIYDDEVGIQTFDQFVNDVRQAVGEKELNDLRSAKE